MRKWFLLALFSIDHMISPAKGETTIPGYQNRDEFIKTGKVWAEPNYDIASQNLLEPSPQCPKFSPSDVIACHYLKPKRGEQIKGWTPKFKCRDANGDKLRIKYGANNAEVYAEAFSSKLLQLIGFKADCNYPVQKVICYDCPTDPARYNQEYAAGVEDPEEELITREFDSVLIEEKFGEEVVSDLNGTLVEGWGFDELLSDERMHADHDQQVAREALTLLMAVLQHGDNKRSNQRLYCLQSFNPAFGCPEEMRYLVVQDLGATLGSYKFKRSDDKLIHLPPLVSYYFLKLSPIWNFWLGPKRSQCTLQVLAVDGVGEPSTLKSKKITEDGRAFLANLLAQVTDEQIAQLVEVSRLGERIPDEIRSEKLKGFIYNMLKIPFLTEGFSIENLVSNHSWLEVIKERINIVRNQSCD